MIKLEKFISKEAAEKLRSHNLHKIAAVMASTKYGVPVTELDMPTVVSLIGASAFYKRSMDSKIRRGIEALNDIIPRKEASDE